MMQKNSNKIFAVSASIIIHAALGSLLILGIFSDRHFAPDLSKLNLAWVSLESLSGKATISPQEKKAYRNQFQTDKINTITAISAAKNVTIQDQKVFEEKGGQAAGKEISNNISGSTAMPAAGNSAAFVSASPLYRENTPPAYPAIAKLRGYEGVVLVNAEILPDGRVGSTAIAKSSGYTILDKSAMEAVKLWKFEPAKKAGKPFAIRVKLPIKFVLHDDNSSS